MDFLEVMLRCVWNIPHYFDNYGPQAKAIIMMGIIGSTILLFATTKGDPTRKAMDREIYGWSSRAGKLMERIDILMPIYEQTLMEYADRAREHIGKSSMMNGLSQGSSEQQDRAEFDVVTETARYEDTAILRMRLEELAKNEK